MADYHHHQLKSDEPCEAAHPPPAVVKVEEYEPVETADRGLFNFSGKKGKEVIASEFDEIVQVCEEKKEEPKEEKKHEGLLEKLHPSSSSHYGGLSVAMQPANTAAATASARIRGKLDNLGDEGTKWPIYRVFDHLRNQNPSAYEPQILAIGPYHHGKRNTKLMEKHKLLYLKSLLGDQSVDPYVSTIEDIKHVALLCYPDSMEDFTPAEFAEMMLLDGCFIIELLRKHEDENWTEVDPIFETEWMLGSIKRDLLLFENQIPFAVLCRLFKLVEGSNHRMLVKLILSFFEGIIPGAGYSMPPDTRISNANDIKHLLHLMHIVWSPDSLPVDENLGSLDTSPENPVDGKQWRFLSAVTKLIWSPASLVKSHKKTVYPKRWRYVSSVTKLMDANVEFKKNDDQKASLFDITFENGTLKLSFLKIVDDTDALFRNLIAYEQYFPEREQHNFATDYMRFLDCIIDSPGDVEILCHRGIFDNCLGSGEVVSNIVNKLTDSVNIRDDFLYAGVCDDMNEYCKKRRNKWMAMLRRNHLSSPWAILSVVAAVVLLLLTAVQTVCSVLQSSHN